MATAGAAWVAMAGVVGCAAGPAPDMPSRDQPSAAITTSSSAAVAPAPKVLLPLFHEAPASVLENERLYDWRTTFAVEPRPKPRTSRKALDRGQLLKPSIKRVTAHVFGFNDMKEVDASVDTQVVADGSSFFDSKARPWAHVHRGKPLSAEQQARLVDLLKDAKAVRSETLPDGRTRKYSSGTTRCGFDPHHAFVFANESGDPVGILEVCFTCGEWSATPALPGGGPRIMWPEESKLMRELCRELELGGCSIGDPKEEEELGKFYSKWYADPELEKKIVALAATLSSGLDGQERVRELDEMERRRACAWSHEQISWMDYRINRRHSVNDRRLECTDDGRTYKVRPYGDCLRDFPTKCEATVAQVEACTRDIVFNLCKENPSCDGIDPSCIWGIRP